MLKTNGYWYATLRCEDGRLRYSTGVKVNDESKASQIRLNRIDKVIAQYVESCKILEKPLLEREIRARLDEDLNGAEKKPRGRTFFEDYQKMVDDMKSGALLKKDGSRFKDGSIAPALNVMRGLQRYEKATGNKFSYTMTMDDYQKFINWLTARDFSKNTIAWYVAYLAGFFSKMYDAGRHTNAVFRKWTYAGEESDTVYLSLEEITRLYKLELKGAQERARDVFVFACWVALRASDLQRINEYERRGDVFEILTGKTSEKVIIPIHWMADKIYKKYGGKLPVYSTAEGLSYHLPTLCKAAEINERRLVVITKGGKKQEEYWYKYDLVSLHTARRSFATNMYLAGFPTRSIMKVTGHRTEESFFKYIRIGKEENAQIMLANPYLKEPSADASDLSAG